MNMGSQERDGLVHEQRRARRPLGTSDRLRRIKDGARLGGVALGVARFVDANPRTVRLIFVATIPLSWGLTVIGYLLLWWLLSAREDVRPSA